MPHRSFWTGITQRRPTRSDPSIFSDAWRCVPTRWLILHPPRPRIPTLPLALMYYHLLWVLYLSTHMLESCCGSGLMPCLLFTLSQRILLKTCYWLCLRNAPVFTDPSRATFWRTSNRSTCSYSTRKLAMAVPKFMYFFCAANWAQLGLRSFITKVSKKRLWLLLFTCKRVPGAVFVCIFSEYDQSEIWISMSRRINDALDHSAMFPL